ncbi:MAG: EAL domain-containing protein, partial [Vicinamibacteria bacterium]
PVVVKPIDEISALIATLHATGQRLEELTAGEVDTVADTLGRPFLLRGPQEHLRAIESARQAAILNALPANVVLLDSSGMILSANESWRQFERENSALARRAGVGVNYLTVCDQAQGPYSAEAPQVAAGVRSVLNGVVRSYSIEYPCHAPSEQRWFLMIVTALAENDQKGAVVMHLNVTARRQAREALAASEAEFHTLAEAMPQIVWIARADGWNTYFNQKWTDYTGLSFDESMGHGWSKSFHQDDRQRASAAWKHAIETTGVYSTESRLRRVDGVYRWWLIRGLPLKDTVGNIVKWFGTCTDTHDLKMAEIEVSRANGALVESERRFSDMLANVKLISVMLDRDARITYCNEYLLSLTGWREADILGADWFTLFVPPEILPLMNGAFASLLANEPEGRHSENPILTRLGERRLIRWSHSVLRSSAGEAIGTASIGEDITEQNRAEARIKHLNRVYAVLSGINTLIVRVRDRDELFRETCRITVELGAFGMAWIAVIDPKTLDGGIVASFGAAEDYVKRILVTARDDRPYSDRPSSRTLRYLQPVICNDIATDPAVGSFRDELIGYGHRSFACLPLTMAGRPPAVLTLFADQTNAFDDEEVRLLLELAGDISFAIDHIEKQEQLDYLAYYDVLTGLANRSLFLERVAQHIQGASAGGHKLALFLFDLERFKNINDSLGRQAGDLLLKQVAEWLTREPNETPFMARISGDHFAAVVPELRADGDVARLLEKRIEAFEAHPFRLNDAVFRVALKTGAAIYPQDGVDAETLFRNAEAALKLAKARGERYLFFAEQMTSKVAGKLTLENQLRQAIENDEFVLHYQPKVNLATGELASAEALIRWNDPMTGLVPPGQFIPVLEETGMIHDVGRWAVHEALTQALKWRLAGFAPIRIAVNVSPRQLRHPNFIAELRQAIGVDTDVVASLEMEITESVIMEDVKHSIATLQDLRAMGITVAIDDFGTGFSSLSYLAKLPVDTLKIDRSFVVDMTLTPEGLALVSTIIKLAHSLRLKVVAEGVETEEQKRLLHLLDCDEMQGFLFSRAVSAADFEASFLRTRTP